MLTRRMLLGLGLLFLVGSHRLRHWLAMPALVQIGLPALSVGLLSSELLCLCKRAGRRPVP